MIEVREFAMLVTLRDTSLLEQARTTRANLAITDGRLFNTAAAFVLHSDHLETRPSTDGAGLRGRVRNGLILGVHIGTLDEAA